MTATFPICDQQRAPRWWLIGRSEDGTYCKIVVIDDRRHSILSDGTSGHRAAILRLSRQVPLQTNYVLNTAGSLAADFVECLPYREQISRSRQSSTDVSAPYRAAELGRIRIRLTPA